jgi:pimeloyl-ACP methyl ester carboxylesterase
VAFPTFTPYHRGGSGTPMVCLHGFTGSWRVWELVLPLLERRHDVLAPTLLGHAGAPALVGDASETQLVDAIERAMDDAGFETAHIVGNSLGGYLALQLAARGRARTVVALAPAGGWAKGDESFRETLDFFARSQAQLETALPHVHAIVSTVEGRRRATESVVEQFEHIPSELVAQIMYSVAACDSLEPMVELALRRGWTVDAEHVTCPVRVVWGTADRLLPWPSSAARYRNDWMPHADWVVLDGVGHCPQLELPVETAQLILGFTA